MARVTPTFIGSAVADSASGNSMTFNKSDLPTLVDGDYLVAVLRCSTSAASADYACSGFARLGEAFPTIGGGGRLIGSYGKAIPTASSEPSTYTFTFTGTAGRESGILMVIREVDTTDPVSGFTVGANYYSGTTYATTVGSLCLGYAANEVVSPNSSTPTPDPDFTLVATHPNATGTGATRTVVWVGARVADTTTAPSVTDTQWASSSGLAHWGISLQGIEEEASTGLVVQLGTGDPARLTVFDGTDRLVPVSAKMYLPGFHSVAAALAMPGATMGHRGASLTAGLPEMSERAYDWTILRGFGMLEFSANRTSDGIWIGCHDPSLNRTSETTGLPDISSQTWATVQTFDNTLNDDGTPRPYWQMIDFLDKYKDTHVLWVDPKSAVGRVTEFLDILDAHGGPTRIVVKYTGNSSGGAALSDAAILRGYQTWGYFYETDGQTAVDTYKSRYTILGMNWDASPTAWSWVTGLGKLVVGHVCASQSAYNTAISKGADLVQCSRPDIITPVSAWNADIPEVDPVNRPANPAMINYDDAGDSPGSNVANWAHPGALVLVGRLNYDDAWVHTVAAGGATVMIYLDAIISMTVGRYHSKLMEESEFGDAVPLWPGSPVANEYGSLNDFRVGSVIHDKLPGVLQLIVDENPHISGLFMDDLGTRSWFPDFDFDSWSSTDQEAYRNGAIAIAQAVRTFADANDLFVMFNGTWQSASGTQGSGGYPSRGAHGCSLADGGFVENHDPTDELAFWSAYAADSAQWGTATPRGIGYNWFSNRSDATARAAWVAADVAAFASSTEYNGPNPAPWGSFTDFGLPKRTS